jgi:hypothetical protein
MATLEEVAREHTLPYLAQHALGILVYYAQRKHQLATESYWFRRQYEHKNWLTTSFTGTSIALRTGTALSPKEVPDLLWFEKGVSEIFWFAYTKLLDGGSSGQVLTVSLSAAEALGRMGEYIMITEALQFSGSWAPLFRREAMKTKQEDAETEPQQEDLVQRMGIVECYALGTIKLFLSFATSVSEEQNERLRTSLSEPDWLSGDRLFTANAPRGLIIELERLKNLVGFEYEVEGVRRTAPWYLRQRIAFAYCTWFSESLNGLLALFESAFGSDIETLLAEKCWLAAALLSSRGLEGCNKFQHRLNILRRSHDAWLSWRGHAEGEWPTVDWDVIDSRIIKLQERIEISAAMLLLPLSRYPKSDSLPDFFGQALVLLGHKI